MLACHVMPMSVQHRSPTCSLCFKDRIWWIAKSINGFNQVSASGMKSLYSTWLNGINASIPSRQASRGSVPNLCSLCAWLRKHRQVILKVEPKVQIGRGSFRKGSYPSKWFYIWMGNKWFLMFEKKSSNMGTDSEILILYHILQWSVCISPFV